MTFTPHCSWQAGQNGHNPEHVGPPGRLGESGELLGLLLKSDQNALHLLTLPIAFPGGTMEGVCLRRQETHGTWIRSLGQEVPLKKEMATRSSILAWDIPWTVEPGGLQSIGEQRVRYDGVTKHALKAFQFHL